MHRHAPTSVEEEQEQLALALAISASLNEGSSRRAPSQPVANGSRAGMQASGSSASRPSSLPPGRPAPAASAAASQHAPASSHYPHIPAAGPPPPSGPPTSQQPSWTSQPVPARPTAPPSSAIHVSQAHGRLKASPHHPGHPPPGLPPPPKPAALPPPSPPFSVAGGATQAPLNSRPAPTHPITGPPSRRAPGAGAPPARQLHPDPTGCAGCGRALLGSYLSALQRRWHPACFVCGFCEEAINQGGNTQFAIGAQDGWPYHMDCFRHRFHPVCHICQQFIPERPDGRVEYKEQAFWREPYCTHHLQDGTPQCCSCSRFQGKGVEFVQLSEGRFLCLTCLGSVVLDTKDVQPLYEEVMAFYRSMGMAHPVKAPLMMVDGTTLNEYSNREGKDSEGGPVFHIRGLTLATVYRTIPSIMRTSGDLGVSSVSTPVKAAGGGGGSVKCSVSAILVLYGLPRLLTGCIIAHELMHAWLRMKNVAGLDQQVEEGLCQLMAYVWLDQQHGQQQDPEQQRLGSFFAYQIREDTSAVYGDGFRTAYDAFQQRGLTAIINDVLRTGRIG